MPEIVLCIAQLMERAGSRNYLADVLSVSFWILFLQIPTKLYTQTRRVNFNAFKQNLFAGKQESLHLALKCLNKFYVSMHLTSNVTATPSRSLSTVDSAYHGHCLPWTTLNRGQSAMHPAFWGKNSAYHGQLSQLWTMDTISWHQGALSLFTITVHNFFFKFLIFTLYFLLFLQLLRLFW